MENKHRSAQFTSEAFTNRPGKESTLISMDGRVRALDNVFVERLWRTAKYEEVYLKDYADPPDAVSHLRAYFTFYNGLPGVELPDPGSRISKADVRPKQRKGCRFAATLLDEF
jgi:hypothetical protein